MSLVLSATDFSCETIYIGLVQDGEHLFACVRASYAKILAFSGAMKKSPYQIERLRQACRKLAANLQHTI